MYVKLIGSLFLIGSAAAAGFVKAEELQVRVKLLLELKRMIGFLQGELRFHRASLEEAFEAVSERIGSPFSMFLKEMSGRLGKKTLNNFEEIWKEQTEILLKEDGFQKEDHYIFQMLGNGLGYLDLNMQTENLNLVMQQTEEALKLAKEVQQVKGKLYQTLGVTAGMFLALLII